MAGFVCYHHCNDLDRPAVSNCSRCGKHLCAECTDLFNSAKTGKILCVACRNNDLENNENVFADVAATRKREMTMIIAGAVIGGVLALILLGVIGPLALLLPFLFGSLGTIYENSFAKFGFLFGIVCFLVMAIVSPIMFIVRLKKRYDERQALEAAIAMNQRVRAGNNAFVESARKIKSGLTGAEMQRLVVQMQSAQANMQRLTTQLSAAQQAGDMSEVEKLKRKLEEQEREMANVKNDMAKGQADQQALHAEQEKLRNELRNFDDLGAQMARFTSTKSKA